MPIAPRCVALLFLSRLLFSASSTHSPSLSPHSLADGSFAPDFDEFAWGDAAGYTEAGPWQYRLEVPLRLVIRAPCFELILMFLLLLKRAP